jgi:transposase InsO family protein/transposase
MLPFSDADDPRLPFDDPTQQRYEVIRPVVVTGDRTVSERAQETGMHPDTVSRLKRRFEKQGMLGLIPDTVEVVPARRRRRVSDEVVEELRRLKGLYDGFGYRELARIIWYKFNDRISHATVRRLWPDLSPPPPEQLPLLDYHSYPERSQARLEVVQLYFQGWSKTSISRFLHVSRTTINEWIRRFEAEDLASLDVEDLADLDANDLKSLADGSHAPKSPQRKVWLPIMLEVYHLQKRHPDAGRFRIWSLLGMPEIHERTVGRVMALNKRVYPDIPHVAKKRRKKEPQPHPFKASVAHEYWFIDGRMMDFEIEGVRWWSVIVLDGYSRTMLAGAVSASEASWLALTVLFTACQRYGVPQYLISDKGSAYISNVVEAVCKRLGIDHRTITGKNGESYMNLMETHFNIQRRLYDYQFSLCRTPIEFEQAHQQFLELYNSTAPQGLQQEKFEPPIPLSVLGEAKGRFYSAEELERKFSRALFPRVTNRYGCVTLHSYHFYVEEGLPKTKVLLWVYGNELRAVFETVVLAEYACRYDIRDRKVKDIRDGRFYRHEAFISDQYALIPLSPEESLVIYRPGSAPRQARLPFPAQQLRLFERVS